ADLRHSSDPVSASSDSSGGFDDLAGRLLRSVEGAARSLAERALQRRLRVAVTGLSRAGKTVFLPSLLHTLNLAARVGEGESGHLPFFEPVAKATLEEVRLKPLRELPAFPFANNVARLRAAGAGFPPTTARPSALTPGPRPPPHG